MALLAVFSFLFIVSGCRLAKYPLQARRGPGLLEPAAGTSPPALDRFPFTSASELGFASAPRLALPGPAWPLERVLCKPPRVWSGGGRVRWARRGRACWGRLQPGRNGTVEIRGTPTSHWRLGYLGFAKKVGRNTLLVGIYFRTPFKTIMLEKGKINCQRSRAAVSTSLKILDFIYTPKMQAVVPILSCKWSQGFLIHLGHSAQLSVNAGPGWAVSGRSPRGGCCVAAAWGQHRPGRAARAPPTPRLTGCSLPLRARRVREHASGMGRRVLR